MRLEGLLMLGRIIARRHLASLGMDAGSSTGSLDTPLTDGGETDGGNSGRKDGAA